MRRWWITRDYPTVVCAVFTGVTVLNSIMMIAGWDEPKTGTFAYLHLLSRLAIIAAVVGLFYLGDLWTWARAPKRAVRPELRHRMTRCLKTRIRRAVQQVRVRIHRGDGSLVPDRDCTVVRHQPGRRLRALLEPPPARRHARRMGDRLRALAAPAAVSPLTGRRECAPRPMSSTAQARASAQPASGRWWASA